MTNTLKATKLNLLTREVTSAGLGGSFGSWCLRQQQDLKTPISDQSSIVEWTERRLVPARTKGSTTQQSRGVQDQAAGVNVVADQCTF